MKPHKDETQSEFMGRCVPEMIGTGPDKRPQEQAVAACMDIWRQHDKAAGSVVQKTHTGHNGGMEFVLSDESLDRMGDVIVADGWRLDNFQKNPVALAFHRPDFAIGKWNNLRIEGKALRGHLELAPEGTSDRIDEIRRLINAGYLKAVSVGFRPIEYEPLNEKGGLRFKTQELVECSVVSVPANANSLATLKSLNISAATRALIFAGQGEEGSAVKRRGFHGGQANATRTGKGSAMSLAQRITAVEAKIVASKDELAALWNTADDTNVSDDQLEKATELRDEIVQLEKTYEGMLATEKLLAGTAVNGNGGNGQQRNLTVYRPPVVTNGNGGEPAQTAVQAPPIIKSRSKEADPVDYMIRAAVVSQAAKSWGKSTEEARAMIGREHKVYDDDGTKGMCELVLRAPSAPAMTTVTGWAAELAQQVWTSPMELLMPAGILTRLAARGMSLSFGRAGRINIPTRSRTPTIAGSFVGEGSPIPVRQGAFTTQYLLPKKLGVITTYTREMDIHSIPAIAALLRDAIQMDTTVAVDSVLIDATAASAIRPAGLLNSISALTATAGGGFAAVVGDVKQLTGALTTATYGNTRSLTWLMNPTNINSLKLTVATNTGVFPWRDELERGTLNGYPVVDSATVPANTVILIDAADFVVAAGDGPTFAASDQATLHMEDTTPLDLVAGSPGVVASPQRSLFQTDSLALRMTWDLNWLMRRSGMLAWTSSVTW
jgi:HK97 family phage prohead protease